MHLLVLMFTAGILKVQADVYNAFGSETEIDRQAAKVACDEVTPCLECGGSCRCASGYITKASRCFPERAHLETCFFSFQCTTHPMVCADDDGHQGVKKCHCHRFYNWSVELKHCIRADNASAMASEIGEKWFLADRIRAHAERVFPGIVAAGVIALSVGTVIAIGCVIFICYRGNWYILENREEDTLPLSTRQQGSSNTVLEAP